MVSPVKIGFPSRQVPKRCEWKPSDRKFGCQVLARTQAGRIGNSALQETDAVAKLIYAFAAWKANVVLIALPQPLALSSFSSVFTVSLGRQRRTVVFEPFCTTTIGRL